VAIEALAEGGHIQVQLLGKAVQLLPAVAGSFFRGALVQEIVVGPELPLILSAMSCLRICDCGLAVEGEINEDDLHQSFSHVLFLDLTGRLVRKTHTIWSDEIAEHDEGHFGVRRALAGQLLRHGEGHGADRRGGVLSPLGRG